MARNSVENHSVLKKLTRSALSVPFAKQTARYAARFAIQRTSLSKKNKQRVYNLVAPEAVSIRPLDCSVRMPSGGELSLKLDLHDELSRRWYYWDYTDYERSTVQLWGRLLENASTVFDVGANIGLYTMWAAARLQGRGTVHSFEPNAEVFSWLSHNVELNCFTHAHVLSSHCPIAMERRASSLRQTELGLTVGRQRLSDRMA